MPKGTRLDKPGAFRHITDAKRRAIGKGLERKTSLFPTGYPSVEAFFAAGRQTAKGFSSRRRDLMALQGDKTGVAKWEFFFFLNRLKI